MATTITQAQAIEIWKVAAAQTALGAIDARAKADAANNALIRRVLDQNKVIAQQTALGVLERQAADAANNALIRKVQADAANNALIARVQADKANAALIAKVQAGYNPYIEMNKVIGQQTALGVLDRQAADKANNALIQKVQAQADKANAALIKKVQAGYNPYVEMNKVIAQQTALGTIDRNAAIGAAWTFFAKPENMRAYREYQVKLWNQTVEQNKVIAQQTALGAIDNQVALKNLAQQPAGTQAFFKAIAAVPEAQRAAKIRSLVAVANETAAAKQALAAQIALQIKRANAARGGKGLSEEEVLRKAQLAIREGAKAGGIAVGRVSRVLDVALTARDIYNAYVADGHKYGAKTKETVNRAAGLLAGAAIGLQAGSAVQPGSGTLIGGAIGAVIGGFLGEKAAAAVSDDVNRIISPPGAPNPLKDGYDLVVGWLS